MFDPDIAPSGTLLGLLQRGRGDGTLHALAAPRAEALAALNDSVLCDSRRDWQVENRSLYYARLYMQLDGGLEEIERHLFHPDDLTDTGEERTGLALSVLGHLAAYGRDAARLLLRSYAAVGGNWRWALDELALRDDDAGLIGLAPAVLARFPETPEGDAQLATAVRDAFEPRPWRLWAEDPRYRARLAAAGEQGSFDRWQRQLRPRGPRPGWSVTEVLEWAQQELEPRPGEHRYIAAARCLSAVAGPEDRAELLRAGRDGPDAARAAVLHHLAERGDPEVLDLVEAAVTDPLSAEPLVAAALSSYERMRSVAAVERARGWAARTDRLGASAAGMLARRGARRDTDLVLAALRRTVREDGPDADALWELVDGAGRLGITCAAPVLRHLYRETSSSHLRGRAAAALAVTDPGFAAGFAVECLWDCEETTRELAARHAATGDDRVVEQLRRLAADPAEEAEVQTAVRARIGPDASAV
ncbi:MULTISPECIES: HEAT repeat domain-containing protein [Streptomyces]|uniref:HEAT repeat domain-containing protein n=1 Tax=Streptomyces TaxID=1883 RepID=UPI001962A04D|nr:MULTISPECIES: HEAT repeat domain-containing protein [Streptomyces]QRX91000.1 HEAT repeat domain-containing protein [Streptomyces noursei]UJB40849.1 HEAT repeat domain-containing protein [Streptomyces sp. A1-5]